MSGLTKVYLCTKEYTMELISETRLSSSKPASTPMDTNVKLTTKQFDEYIRSGNSEKSNTNDPLVDQGAYQRLVGKLLYLTVTRPNIAFGVNTSSQFLLEIPHGSCSKDCKVCEEPTRFRNSNV